MVEKNIPTDKIEPNPWNPNRMPQDLYEGLKIQMIAEGDLGIDPIIVTPKNVYYGDPQQPSDEYVIVDGEHRWRAAREIGWADIPCDVWNLSEGEAKSVSYKRNKLRGSMDPYREAELFQSMLKILGTQEAVAEFFGVNRILVTQRLSILKLDEAVRKVYESVPRGTLSVSHLESVASIPDSEAQVGLVKKIVEYDLPVREVESRVSHIKKELERRERLRKAIENHEYQTCPGCGVAPNYEAWKGLPWVRCSTGGCPVHSWNLETGETDPPNALDRSPNARQRPEAEESEPARQPPRSFRYMESPKEISVKLTKRVLNFMGDVQRLRSFHLSGEIKVGDEVREIHVDFDPAARANSRMSYHERVGGWDSGQTTSFNAEPKDYKKFEEKSLVHGSYGGADYDRAVKHLEALRRFLDEL